MDNLLVPIMDGSITRKENALKCRLQDSGVVSKWITWYAKRWTAWFGLQTLNWPHKILGLSIMQGYHQASTSSLEHRSPPPFCNWHPGWACHDYEARGLQGRQNTRMFLESPLTCVNQKYISKFRQQLACPCLICRHACSNLSKLKSGEAWGWCRQT